MSTSGGEPEVLARPSDRVGSWWDVCWLPDGRSLVSSSFNVTEAGLYRIDTRSREVAPLPGSERLLQPKCRWQGGILAVEPPNAGSSGRRVLRAYSPESGVVSGVGDVYPLAYPTWTRDGRAFVGLNLVTRRVERVWRDTLRVETLADLGGVPLEGLTASPWMGLAPDDAPLVLRSHDTRELYALDWETP